MKKDIMDVSVSSMSESPRRENPEENAHEKIRGEVTVVKSEPTSEKFAAVNRKRSSSSSGGALVVMIHLKFMPKWLPQNKQHIKPGVPRVSTPPSFGSGWMPPSMVGG